MAQLRGRTTGAAPAGDLPPRVFLNESDLDDTTMRRIRALNDVAAARGQSFAQLAEIATIDKTVQS